MEVAGKGKGILRTHGLQARRGQQRRRDALHGFAGHSPQLTRWAGCTCPGSTAWVAMSCSGNINAALGATAALRAQGADITPAQGADITPAIKRLRPADHPCRHRCVPQQPSSIQAHRTNRDQLTSQALGNQNQHSAAPSLRQRRHPPKERRQGWRQPALAAACEDAACRTCWPRPVLCARSRAGSARRRGSEARPA